MICLSVALLHYKLESNRNHIFLGYLLLSDSLEKTLMLGKIEGRRRRGRQKRGLLDGITNPRDVSEQTLGDGEGQESLAFCSPYRLKESDMTEKVKNSNPKLGHMQDGA